MGAPVTAFAPGVTPIAGASAAARRMPDGSLRGCLIRGAPLSGKSSLVVSIVALGGLLVSDDVVGISQTGDLTVHAPETRFAGLLHLRETGVMRLPFIATAPLVFVIDLTPIPAPNPAASPAANPAAAPPLPAAAPTPPQGRVRAPGALQLLQTTIPRFELCAGPATAAAVYCLLGGAEIIDPDKI